MHIGLIGGIGVAATVVYYQRLTAEMAARGARLELTIVQAQVADLVRNFGSDNRAEQAEIYAELIGRLRAAGADVAAITSLGGHFCFAETEALSPLPLVSGVTPLDDFFVEQGIGAVGLLGTRVVMESGLYGQLARTRHIIPKDALDSLGQAYQDMAIAGTCGDATRAQFFEAGARLMAQGAEAIVLAGTDLNLAFDGRPVDYPVIDALDVHVQVLADLASGAS